jgi:hypothetical protein
MELQVRNREIIMKAALFAAPALALFTATAHAEGEGAGDPFRSVLRPSRQAAPPTLPTRVRRHIPTLWAVPGSAWPSEGRCCLRLAARVPFKQPPRYQGDLRTGPQPRCRPRSQPATSHGFSSAAAGRRTPMQLAAAEPARPEPRIIWGRPNNPRSGQVCIVGSQHGARPWTRHACRLTQ